MEPEMEETLIQLPRSKARKNAKVISDIPKIKKKPGRKRVPADQSAVWVAKPVTVDWN